MVEVQCFPYVKLAKFLLQDIVSARKKDNLNKLVFQFQKDPEYLLKCFVDFEESELFNVLLINFLFKVEFALKQSRETTVTLSGEALIQIIKFVSSQPDMKHNKQKFKNYMKEYFEVMQEKFFALYVKCNRQKLEE